MCPTHVVNIYILIVAHFLVLDISRDNELVTSRDRDLKSLVNHHRVKQESCDLRLGRSASDQCEFQVLSKGEMRACAEGRINNTDSVEGDRNRTSVRIVWEILVQALSQTRLVMHTCDHLAGVVDHALVVFIFTVRKVHAH